MKEPKSMLRLEPMDGFEPVGKSKAVKKTVAFVISVLFAILPAQAVLASMAEHQAVLDLVPMTSVDRQVVKSGAWSNPATWSGGKIPLANENIYVPNGMALTVDIYNNAIKFNTLRVDGLVKFNAAKNVLIKLDTLVVTSSGALEIGSEATRVAKNVKIQVLIANNGPIDRIWDPENISRGVILQGKTRIFGAEKSAYHQLKTNPGLGATQIELAEVPTGWSTGDVIAITATKYRGKKKSDISYQTEDELKAIKSITGNIVTLGQVDNATLSSGLQYSHIPTIKNMPVYAANLTRNVVFMGEGGGSVPTAQRGHFMVMHNPDTIIKGAGFYHLGRTDKSIPLDDFKLNERGFRLTDVQGKYIPDAKNNPRGRYAVHFHHTGTDIDTLPAVCSGNAVIGSDGWGFVNHASYVIMENNASFDVYGSHFVSEDGNEMGAFKNNIAIKSEGRNAIVKEGLGNHDHGHTGHGLWLHSRNMVVENNVVSGVRDSGLVYYHRNSIEGLALDIHWKNLLTPTKNITKGKPTIYFSHIPIISQKNTVVLASGSALNVVKSNREQGHDLRNMIESLKGYALVEGLKIQYVAKYTFRDLELVADAKSSHIWDRGVNVGIKDRDVVFVNTKVSGFVHPFVTGDTFQGLPDKTDVVFVNTMVDGRLFNPETDIHKDLNETVINYDPTFHQVMDSPVADNVQKLATAEPDNTYNFPAKITDGFTVTGVKSDTAGDTSFDSDWDKDSLIALLKKGYYTLPDGSKCIILVDAVADRLTGETKNVFTKLKNVDNYGQLGPFLNQFPF